MARKLVETLVTPRRVFKGRMVDFRADLVRLPNGRTATREHMDHPGAVGVVPFLDPETVVLVRQYRFPVREITLELPAGKLDRGEPALACVKRELREETGFTAKRIKPLLTYWPTAAFANEILYLFVAQDLVRGKLQPDEDEFIETVELPFAKALEAVRTGRIKDSKTVIGLLACAQWRGAGPRRKK